MANFRLKYNNFYQKYKNTILFNKNLILSGIAAFCSIATIKQQLSTRLAVMNNTWFVVTEVISPGLSL
jgi:hypothetical protein